MFGKFSEQLKKSSKPVNSFLALNAKTMEDLSQHQTELFTGLLSDSVKYMESVSVQSELKGVMAANSEYAESMRDRLASVSKDAYSTLSKMQAQVTDVIKSSLDTAAEDVAKEVKTQVKKAPVAEPVKSETVKATDKAEAATKETTAVAAKATEKAAEVTPEPAATTPSASKPAPKTAAKKTTTRTRKTATSTTKSATKAANTSTKSTS